MESDSKVKLVVALLILMVVLVISAKILGQFSDTFGSSETLTYTNETIDPALNGTTGTALNAVSYQYFQSLDTTSVAVINATSGELLTSGNYTIDTGGYFNLTTEGALVYNGSRLNINYTTTNTALTELYNITTDSEQGNAEIAAFGVIMGILIAVIILFSFLFSIKA